VPSLAAGASSAGSTTVTIPAGTCSGSYYIIARADTDNAVLEITETNNTSSKVINIGPDLIVSALTGPSTAGAGQTISVSDTTRNNGGCTAGEATTKLYWSANSTYDVGDTELGSRSVPSLAAGIASAGIMSVSTPADASTGTYYIIARADAGSIVPETIETNNTKSWTIKIGPDLIVSALTAPSTAGEGQTISVTDTTKNNGAGAAGASITKLYWSANSAYDAGDTELGSRSVPSLAAGASSAGSTTVTIPSGTTSGTYYIIARTDADSIVPETSETNNTLYRSIIIGIAGPDLIVSALTAPSTAGEGQAISVTDTTKNNGAGTAGASTTKLYWSVNSAYDAGDTELGSRSVPSLAAGASSAGSTTVTIPSGTTSGTYYIIARTDADSIVPETSETNNTINRFIAIGTVLPDLTIPYISAPASATAGSSIDVTDVTRNIGAVTSGASTTRLYLSADTVLNAGDIELAGRAVPSLVSFGFSNMVTQVTIPANTSSGTYYIIVVSDADGVIAETNEANNSNYKAIVINP
jgi:subtilase family serine protease